MSRRDFTSFVGKGSAVAAGMVWAAPKISTVKLAKKAAAGSPPPGTTTTTTTIAGQGNPTISVSNASPCGGDTIAVNGRGFVPKTAVSLEIDSPANSLGVTTADSNGNIAVTLRLPTSVPTGSHNLVAVGVQAGGRTLTLEAPLHIKTRAECETGPEGSTATTLANTGTTGVAGTTTPGTTRTTGNGKGSSGTTKVSNEGSPLAFTGTDTVDLALIGAAAAVGGRALLGLVGRDRDEDDEEA